MLRRVALVRTDVSEELSTTFIRVTRIGELGTTLGISVPSSPILVILMKEALRSSETSVLTRATRHNIPEDAVLHSHCRENLKSYIFEMNCETTVPYDSWHRITKLRIISGKVLTIKWPRIFLSLWKSLFYNKLTIMTLWVFGKLLTNINVLAKSKRIRVCYRGIGKSNQN
jgi:hypothetical protein